MALAPKFAGQAFSAGVNPKTVHTVELCMLFPFPVSEIGRVNILIVFTLSEVQHLRLTSIELNSLDLDYVCPFSAKMFKTVYNSVLPTISNKYSGKVKFLFRQQIQPWHPSSTLVVCISWLAMASFLYILPAATGRILAPQSAVTSLVHPGASLCPNISAKRTIC